MATRSVSIKSELSAVKAFLSETETFLVQQGIGSSARFDIHLILEELLANIAQYAFDDTRDHRIDVRVTTAGGEVTIEIRDDGIAFDPTKQPRPDTGSDIEERQVGGLGMYLVGQLSDSFEYCRRGGMNTVQVSVSDRES